MKFKWAIVALALLAGCARFHSQPISPSETAASLQARTLDSPPFRDFLKKNLPRQFDTWPPKSWDFEMLSLAALYYHPSLEVARAQWHTALGANETASARPNPTVSVVPGYDFNPTGQLSPWLPLVNFDLPIETMGKRAYRTAQARQLSESARLNIAATAWQVRSELRSSLIDYAAARQRETLLQEQTALEEKIVRSTEQQLEAGAVSSLEARLAGIALAKNQLDLTDARRQGVEARSRVAEAIGVPLKALNGVQLDYDLSAAFPAAGELTSPDVRDQALQNRSDILGALAEYAASQSALQLEIARQYPDIHIGPGYQYDHGEHTFIFSITSELPLLNQNQGPIAEAQGRRTEAAARFIALQAKVIAEIDRAVASYRVTRDNLSALDSLAATQQKQSDAVAAQVQAGAASQVDLLNAQVELTANELAQLDGRVKLQQSFGALEDAVQRPIETMKPALIEQGHFRAVKDKP